MFLKILIIFLSLCIIVKNQENISVCSRDNNKLKSVTSGFVDSFVRLKNKLSKFFRLKIKKPASTIEKKRKKLKKALHNFIGEVFYDETSSSNNKALKHQLVGVSDETTKESQMSAVQLGLHHGYEVEAHTVQTRDGYMLRLHRILPTMEGSKTVRNVILHHGLMGSSDDWLLLGPNRALPYLLINAGYDVWLTNARGNKYSRFMISLSDSSSKFWNFSFHEMGTLDLPAVIDYVKDQSKSNSEIDFIGYSMGATALLALLSSLPQYNQVLKSATLLAPLAFMYQIKGPLKLLAEFLGEDARNSLNFLGVNEFMPIEAFPSEVIEKYCQSDDDDRLCLNPFLLIANGGKKIRNESVLENVLGHLPAGASTKTIMHYLQLVNSGQFRMYDHGAPDNLRNYGVKLPPEYYLYNITLPIVLFSSSEDWLSTNMNIVKLLHMLPNVAVHHVIREQGFSHTDFIFGDDAFNLVFQLVVEVLAQLNEENADI